MNNDPHMSNVISFEKLGPPGVKGELHVLAMMEHETRSDTERLMDKTQRLFKIAARLAKASQPTGNIEGDFGPNDGSSYLHIPHGYVMNRIHCPDGTFEIKKNDQGEQSLIEFECEASGTEEAKAKFLRTVLPFLDYQSFIANCPLFVTTIRVEDTANLRTSFDYTAPYRSVVINSHVKYLHPELWPVYALYRDAKNSHSAFYSFLCYHKILDGLLGTMRANLRTHAEKKNIKLTPKRDLVPDAPEIHVTFKNFIGKPIRTFFDSVMTPQFRNAVAHFIQKDGRVLNLSSPEEAERYDSILYISELCVRVVIEGHEGWLAEMEAKA